VFYYAYGITRFFDELIVTEMKRIVRFILALLGWKLDENVPVGIDKCVIVMGPHTSNWDFIIGRMAWVIYGVKPKILIKKELFFFPLGWILRAVGGIPVDRKKNNNMTDFAVNLFQKEKSLFLVFTPEGTRSYNPNWKKGFYYIARKAQVPIYICYMDYERKMGGVHSVYYPTDNVNEDIAHIKGILKQYKGKYPEKGIH
jgi:1-acyl-sn-glycerol-3-phosphate acyltransferase